MKGTVSASSLAAAVKTAQSIIATGINIDSLKHVRLTARDGMLEVEATNLDQHMAVRLSAALSDGIAIADPARLLMTLAPISGEASISCTDGFMSISGKGSRSRLALLPNDLWANVEKPASENSFDVEGESLAAAFQTVQPAVMTDPSRYYLMGAHLRWVGQDLIAEATNGNILLARGIVARQPKQWPGDSIIAPGEFMVASGKIIGGDSATLSVTENRIILNTPKGWLASKLIAGTFPNTDRVWDKNAQAALRADRKSLADIAALAGRFSQSNGNGDRTLVIHAGEVLASGNNGENFRAEFQGEYIKEISYCFQPNVLLAALSAFTSENIELTDGGSMPNTVTINGDGARTCLAMQYAMPAWWIREQAREAA